MRVLLLAPGTRGDVAPAAALGAAFMADGHEVTIVADAEYGTHVTDAGCALVPFTAAMAPEEDFVSGSFVRELRAHLASLRTYMDEGATAALAAARHTDVIVTNAISPYGHDIAEGLGIPSTTALLQPSHPSAAYPPMIASAKDFGAIGNRLAGRIGSRIRAPYDPACERMRSEFRLPRESRRAGYRRRLREGMRVHHGISPAVLSRPRDWPAPLTLDGFWWPHDPPNWTPPAELRDFLAAGEAPVVISLGSMSPDSIVARAVAEALAVTKRRVIVQGEALRAATEELDNSRVMFAGDVPHSWLLPQASAVVHHAGAGITSSTLRAGIPAVPIPAHTDQPYWARRLVALDAATPPIRVKHASGATLSAAIDTAVTSARFREGAQAVRDAMAGEDGTIPLRNWLREAAGGQAN